MKHKMFKKVLSLFTGVSLTGFVFFKLLSPSFAIISFDSILSITKEKTVLLTEEQLIDEANWFAAEEAISGFYRNLNLFRYEEARDYLTEGFAKNNSNYSVEKLVEWESKKLDKTKVTNITRNQGESKLTTKVFNYQTQYTLKETGEVCGDNLVAYVVLRDGRWTIDTIQIDSYTKCV